VWNFISKSDIIKRLSELNKDLLILVFVIFFCGLILLYSVGNGNIRPWALKQFIFFIIFLPVCIVISIVDIQFWFTYSYLIYFAGLCLLILVEVVGHKSMGATRWIDLGVIKLQPSEIIKICFTLALAKYFFQKKVSDVKKNITLIKPILLFIFPFLLILKQPNLGTALILAAIMVSILFLVGVQMWKFILCFIIGLGCIPVIWNYGLHDYQKQRILTFLSPESDPLNSGYNVTQSKIAIGSGGVWGTGFLKGLQGQLEFLPEKHTDFIFTVLCEEFGFIGSMFVTLLYTSLLMFLVFIIIKCNHSYGKIVVGGVFINLFCHFFINVGMITGILPVVGIPFPLLSYGGSVTVSTLISIGFVLNVDLYKNKEIKVLL
jgi:rod shape determining protein RodA